MDEEKLRRLDDVHRFAFGLDRGLHDLVEC